MLQVRAAAPWKRTNGLPPHIYHPDEVWDEFPFIKESIGPWKRKADVSTDRKGKRRAIPDSTDRIIDLTGDDAERFNIPGPSKPTFYKKRAILSDDEEDNQIQTTCTWPVDANF